jgi:hypothetical protein
MGGKNKTSAAKVNSTMEALAALTANIGQLCGKIENLEKSLHELSFENTVVREELAAARKDIIKRDETIAKLTEQVNQLDQDARASSLPIVGLPNDADPPPPHQRFMKSSGDLPPTVNPILQYTINQAFACRPWLICRPAAAEPLPPFCLLAGCGQPRGGLNPIQ